MNKKQKIYYLRNKIMCDVEKLNVLLEIITSNRAGTYNEAVILASLALAKSKQIDRNNEKIGKILGH